MVDQKLTCVAFEGIWSKKAKFRNVLDRKKEQLEKTVS